MVLWQSFKQAISVAAFFAVTLAWSATEKSDWQTADYDMQAYDKALTELYASAKQKKIEKMPERIAFFSAAFLGKPYELGALGEGQKGHYDQKPFYRTDSFDCLTYTSTVLALAQSDTFSNFKKHMANVQYREGKIAYVNRNHFTSFDWNSVNQKLGYIKDITRDIKSESGWPVYKTAKAYINKGAWYQQKTLSTLNLIKPTDKRIAESLLRDLKKSGSKLKNEYSAIDYIPLTVLFAKNGKPNFYLFSQIPDGSIVEIVRPNWNLEKIIGTNLHVSHLGFVIHTPEGIMFREASTIHHEVVDIPLTEYLRNYLDSPTIKGINIQAVVTPSS